MPSRTALVVGATGLVGAYVVEALCARAEVARVVVLARRAAETTSAKVGWHVVDFDGLDASLFQGIDDVYACLGTTMKQAGSREAFRKVDYAYTLAVAEQAKRAGAARIALISSVGADPRSSNFYLRTKGETERDVEALGFATFVVARPSLIIGERPDRRALESLAMAASRAAAFTMIGGLRRYRPIEARAVGEALVVAMLEATAGRRNLHYDDLEALSRR